MNTSGHVHTIVCENCGNSYNLEENMVKESKCSECGQPAAWTRLGALLFIGWSRPWRKLPFLLWLLMVVVSVLDYARPAAPCAAGLALVAWMIRPARSWFFRGVRTYLLPTVAGVALFALVAVTLHLMGSTGRAAPEKIEDVIITLGFYLEPIAEMKLVSWLVVLACLLVFAFVLQAWKATRRILILFNLAATINIALVAFASFSFFGAPRMTEQAHSVVRDVADHWHSFRYKWENWEERAEKAELLGPLLREEITSSEQFKAETKWLAGLDDPRNKDPEESATDLWTRSLFATPLDPSAQRYSEWGPPYGWQGASYWLSRLSSSLQEMHRINPLSPDSDTARLYQSSPSRFDSNSPRDPRGRLPSVAIVREARIASSKLPALTETAKLRIATQVELMENTISSALGEITPGKQAFSRQLANSLVEAAIGEFSIEDIVMNPKQRVARFLQRLKNVPSDLRVAFREWIEGRSAIFEKNYSSFGDRAKARSLFRAWRPGNQLSKEEIAILSRLSVRELKDIGFICGRCGLPLWFPKCPAGG